MDIENKIPDKNKGKKTLKKVIGVGLIIAVGTASYGLWFANYSKVDKFLKTTMVKVIGEENASALRRVNEGINNYMANGLAKIFDGLGISYDR